MTGQQDYLLRVVVTDPADFERLHSQHLTRLPGWRGCSRASPCARSARAANCRCAHRNPDRRAGGACRASGMSRCQLVLAGGLRSPRRSSGRGFDSSASTRRRYPGGSSCADRGRRAARRRDELLRHPRHRFLRLDHGLPEVPQAGRRRTDPGARSTSGTRFRRSRRRSSSRPRSRSRRSRWCRWLQPRWPAPTSVPASSRACPVAACSWAWASRCSSLPRSSR